MPIEKQDVSYKTALGLESDPFSPVPDQDQDQRFYYAFEAFEQRLTLLKRLVRGKDVLILVIGELGSGKTTLLNRYLASADAAWKTCRLRTPSTADPKRRQLLKNLNNHPAYLLKDAGDPVIIIDDAHKLTRIELQFLLQDALAPDSARKVKRLVLVGESGLNATFAALAAKIAGETAVNKIYLPSISVEEAGAYLRHRLAVAGFAGKSPLSASVVKKLHRKTGGLPGKINASAHWWLKNTYAHDNRSRGIFSWIERRRLLILGGATAGACALGLVWILSMSDRNESSLQTAHPTSTPRVVRVKIPPEGRIIRPKSDIATTPANIQKDRRSVIVANSEKKTAPVKIPPPATVAAPKNDKSTPVKTQDRRRAQDHCSKKRKLDTGQNHRRAQDHCSKKRKLDTGQNRHPSQCRSNKEKVGSGQYRRSENRNIAGEMAAQTEPKALYDPDSGCPPGKIITRIHRRNAIKQPRPGRLLPITIEGKGLVSVALRRLPVKKRR
jgi:MSHA biogenesis protein MshM